ncbi:RNB-like domain-containing protein [Cryptosporidium andersoni]|uniref:RNB-like domain-containing protein n=1 Tax=Cryptosporidium andersoni TaxID=117008 RepID=A0A1J4MWD3_9CRYT|nr:RNB-like domain-containing protein [Cryptosporidium andersoni]
MDNRSTENEDNKAKDIHIKDNSKIFVIGIIKMINPYEGLLTVSSEFNNIVEPYDVYISGWRNLNGAIDNDKVSVEIIGPFTKRYKQIIKSNETQILDIKGKVHKYLKSKTLLYEGKVYKIYREDNKRYIIGYLRPISYLYKNFNEKKLRNNKLLNRTEILIRNSLNSNNKRKYRQDLIETKSCITYTTRQVVFVPLLKVYPLIKIHLRSSAIKKLLAPFTSNMNNTKKIPIPLNILYTCNILQGTSTSRYIKGILKGIYGSIENIGTQMNFLMDDYNVSDHLNSSDTCDDEIKDVNPEYDKYRKYFDPNKYRVFTIDPSTARDLDDAIHIEWNESEQIYELGVHIADVLYYLKDKNDLINIVKKYCTSIYLPHINFPMLPGFLSSNLCSLLPSVNRRTLSIIFKLDKLGNLLEDVKYYHGTICSLCKFSYEQVDEILLRIYYLKSKFSKRDMNNLFSIIRNDASINNILKDVNLPQRYWKKLLLDIFNLQKLTNILRNNRRNNMAIKFSQMRINYYITNDNKKEDDDQDIECKSITFNDNDYGELQEYKTTEFHVHLLVHDVKNIQKSLDSSKLKHMSVENKYSISHSIIEELMIKANQLTAEYLINNLDSKVVLRCHAEIEKSKLSKLIKYLRGNGMDNIFGDSNDRKALFEGLCKVEKVYGYVIYNAISELLRDIFKRAKYISLDLSSNSTLDEAHHYALNVPFYTHFTSPIRRVADIIVHQLIYYSMHNSQNKLDKDNLSSNSNSTKKGKSKDSKIKDEFEVLFTQDDISEICNNANKKSKASKDLQREAEKMLFSYILKKQRMDYPNMSCVICTKNFGYIKVVLMSPTEQHNLCMVTDSDSKYFNSFKFSNNNSINLPLSYKYHKLSNQFEVTWKYSDEMVDKLITDMNSSTCKYKSAIQQYFDLIQSISSRNKFYHLPKCNTDKRTLIQIVNIWTFLPVYIVPINSIPTKYVLIPIHPLEYAYYKQISIYN